MLIAFKSSSLPILDFFFWSKETGLNWCTAAFKWQSFKAFDKLFAFVCFFLNSIGCLTECLIECTAQTGLGKEFYCAFRAAAIVHCENPPRPNSLNRKRHSLSCNLLTLSFNGSKKSRNWYKLTEFKGHQLQLFFHITFRLFLFFFLSFIFQFFFFLRISGDRQDRSCWDTYHSSGFQFAVTMYTTRCRT